MADDAPREVWVDPSHRMWTTTQHDASCQRYIRAELARLREQTDWQKWEKLYSLKCAENEALLKDATRYRWLRSNHWKPRSRNVEIDAGYSCTFMAGSWLPSAGMDMDEAVDFFASAGSGEGK
jgi:hypothetical protein